LSQVLDSEHWNFLSGRGEKNLLVIKRILFQLQRVYANEVTSEAPRDNFWMRLIARGTNQANRRLEILAHFWFGEGEGERFCVQSPRAVGLISHVYVIKP
jgi:hypothetical protein